MASALEGAACAAAGIGWACESPMADGSRVSAEATARKAGADTEAIGGTRRTAVWLAPQGNGATQRQSGELLRTGGRVCGLGLETTERTAASVVSR